MNFEKMKEWEILQAKLNRICNSMDFRVYMTSKFHFLPRGLTLEAGQYEEEEESIFYISLSVMDYGYNSISNNGLSEYSDLSDIRPDSRDYSISDEMEIYARDYIKEKYPEIYNNPRYIFK